MPTSYPLYQAGVNTGEATAAASIGGAGVQTLGSELDTLTSSGAVSNVLDDGAGNASFKTLSTSSPTFSTPTLSSGTAGQNLSGSDATYVILLTSTGAGTYTIAIGPTNAVADVICTTAALATTVTACISIPVPKNWFIKLTLVNITITSQSLINI